MPINATVCEVLAGLEKGKPFYVSGETIAGNLNISRAAVWKAVNALKRDGYEIESAANKGYRLVRGPDRLYAEGIRAGLLDFNRGLNVFVKQSVSSTNDEAKVLAISGAAHGTLIAAEEQSGGRGRYSRSFYSPFGTGLYMSVVLRPGLKASEAPIVTVAAALAVCRSIRGLTGLSPAIKWVNDVMLYDKKICGILTEATSDAENGAVSSMVVGIGLNVSARDGDFPPELHGVAGSIYPDGNPQVSRNAFAASIINELLALCDRQIVTERAFMSEYRELSCVLGKRIRYIRNGESGEGLAADIDGDGRLIVIINGSEAPLALDSGEVSITAYM